MSENIYQDLPKITVIHSISDGGPGGASCPHCGAIGRWVIYFEVEGDEELRGAMRGCFKHYPVSDLAWRSYELMMKQAEKGTLNGWDQSELDIINEYSAGKLVEWEAKDQIKAIQRKRNGWMKKSGYRR